MAEKLRVKRGRLSEYVAGLSGKEEVVLGIDIETYQYNEAQGRKNPSSFRNKIYSLEVGWILEDTLYLENFVDSLSFFTTIISCKSKSYRGTFVLLAHNGNRYDFHYLRRELIDFFGVKIENDFLKDALDEANLSAVKRKELKKSEKETGVLLERRVKSKTELSFDLYLKGCHFRTNDSWQKTNLSLRTLGEKLIKAGVMEKEYGKSSYNYTKYNLDRDLSWKESVDYAKEINAGLDKQEKVYIENDIIVLMHVYAFYTTLFPGFDWGCITFTQNILHYYTEEGRDRLASYQLLHRFFINKQEMALKNSDFTFAGENFYSYLKHYYKGGLNFYNDRYVAKIIHSLCFGIDINSSYPYQMYSRKLPYKLVSYEAYDKSLVKELPERLFRDDNFFHLYQVPKFFFQQMVDRIESEVGQKMMVKYYSSDDDYVYITDATFRLLSDIWGVKMEKILMKSCLTYSTCYFSGREKIATLYYKKQQGKCPYEISKDDPLHIKVNKSKKNSLLMTPEERANVKVLLNGLYGIPALRAYFNLARYEEEDYTIYHNAYKNSERNLIFSIFVTSYALYRLLEPLKFFTAREIDENFLYTDTDSLYLKNQGNRMLEKIPPDFLDDYNLGAFSLDVDDISDFYILNHKKYAYKKSSSSEVQIHCGGVPLSSFDTTLPFEDFVKKEFHPGVVVPNTSNCYNKDGTISIYEKATVLEAGSAYSMECLTLTGRRKKVKDEVRKALEKHQDEVEKPENALYVESSVGSFSIQDLYEESEEAGERDLSEYQALEKLYTSMI